MFMYLLMERNIIMIKTCSNMNEPIKVSQIYAEKIGYTQCKKCY